MALISCKECGKNVSSAARECNGCGFPIADYLAHEAASNAAEALSAALSEAALRPDASGGKVLISHTYDDLNIIVKYRLRAVELIVNGMVCDEFKGLLALNVDLKVYIGNTYVKATLSSWAGTVKIFVNSDMVAEGKL